MLTSNILPYRNESTVRIGFSHQYVWWDVRNSGRNCYKCQLVDHLMGHNHKLVLNIKIQKDQSNEQVCLIQSNLHKTGRSLNIHEPTRLSLADVAICYHSLYVLPRDKI